MLRRKFWSSSAKLAGTFCEALVPDCMPTPKCRFKQTVHARVGGVQPLNLEANWEMALFGYPEGSVWNAVCNKNPKLTRQRVSLHVDL